MSMHAWSQYSVIRVGPTPAVQNNVLSAMSRFVKTRTGPDGRGAWRWFWATWLSLFCSFGSAVGHELGGSAQSVWKPVAGKLMTRWASEVTPERVHPEYPRPHLVRPHWINLNGLWDYVVLPRGHEKPAQFAGNILVPFPIESALSGVGRFVQPTEELWYRRSFVLMIPPEMSVGGRWLLHFGAVDWQATVWVNGQLIGSHEGGYDPFTLDITDAVLNHQRHELIVRVWDPTDQGVQPRGKQVLRPHGIWYTPVTGIWQTVWLEYVPAVSIADITVLPDVDHHRFTLQVTLRGTPGEDGRVWAEVWEGQTVVSRAEQPVGQPLRLPLDNPRLWSPDSPFLYTLKVGFRDARGNIDEISSYAGLRKISLGRDHAGYVRLFLNDKPLFQLGPLDQGWWPDGLYTAPTDEALRYDLEMTKKLGYNMIRKHVKVEPARWYYHCDQLGLLVWQDMPNGDRHIGPQDADLERTAESESIYRREWQAIIQSRRHHPCIVVWVPFNEGWGQFKTNEILNWTKQLDPTRLVDGPSGWTDRGGGDMHDIHRYPGPAMPRPEEQRAAVLGEFGGLGLPVRGHLWNEQGNWGYRTFTTQEDLQLNYETLLRRLKPLIARGLAAAVYTQTTDVEIEVNGWMTYDRAVLKLDLERTANLHRPLYEPQQPIKLAVLVPTSEQEAQMYRYRFERPPDGWFAFDYDDASWPQGPGGFGERTTPGSVVRTEWKTSDVWLRRVFHLDQLPHAALYLRIHHDEDAEVYLNGQRIAFLTGYTTEYEELELGEEARRALRLGRNVLAVHCRQTGGGQYIDLGILTAVPP